MRERVPGKDLQDLINFLNQAQAPIKSHVHTYLFVHTQLLHVFPKALSVYTKCSSAESQTCFTASFTDVMI